MIVATGATGQLGRQVVERLMEMISPSTIAVSVRDPEKAAGMAAAGIEVRKSDFTDHDSMVRAFTGADKVLIISTRGPDVVSEHLGAVAAAAASVLATSGHEDRIYDITGPDSVGWRDLVAVASEVVGHDVPYAPVSLDELEAGPNAVMADYYGGISRGEYDIVSDAVLEITGRPPSSAATFVRRTVREALAHRAAGV